MGTVQSAERVQEILSSADDDRNHWRANRAKRLLVGNGLLTTQEMYGVNGGLDAAALTYVAAAAQAISTLSYYVFLLTGRNNE